MPHAVSSNPPKPRHRSRAAACAAALVVSTALAGGAALAPASAVTAQASTTVASKPLNFTAKQTGPGEVTLRWSPPANASTSNITSYEPGYSGGEWGDGTSVGPDRRSVVFHDLGKGALTFSVAAFSGDNWGARVSVPLTVSPGAPAPSAAVSRTTLVAGQRLTISGKGYPGSWVSIERALPGKAYASVGNGVQTDATTGSYSYTQKVSATATWRVRGGSGAVSGGHKVVAKNALTLAATRTAVRTYTLSGTVAPAVDGQAVTLATRRSDGTYAALATVHTGRLGKWSYSHTYPSVRTYTFRARSVATTRNAANSVTLAVPVS